MNCNGDRPTCSRCRRTGSTCIYASDSIVAQNALKRKHKELQEASDNQAELLHILRTRDHHDAQSILQRLRTGESVETLVKFIKQGDLLLDCRLKTISQTRYPFPMLTSLPPCLTIKGNPYVDSILYRRTFFDQQQSNPSPPKPLPASDKKYDWPYHAAELVEADIDRARPSQWTTVIDSDELARTLLKAYLYYDFSHMPLMHKSTFIGDMSNMSKAYCSSLLMNAIFACACHSHKIPGSSTDFWNPREMRYQFMAEARRLWERERSRKHITTVQAAALMACILNCDGMDKVGFQYLQFAIDMARDMGLFSTGSNAEDPRAHIVYPITAWGVFGLHTDSMHTFHIRQAPILTAHPPQLPRGFSSEDLCVMYPQASYSTKLHHSLVFEAACNLHVIMHDVVRRMYGTGKGSGRLSLREAFQFRDRLYDWYGALPTVLQRNEMIFPAHIKLHFHYFILLIFLFDRFKQGAHGHSDMRESPDDIASARETAESAWTAFESLMYIYYARHGFEACDTLVLPFLDLLGYGALRDVKTTNGTVRASRLATLFLCAKGLREQADRYYIAEVMFFILRDSLEPDDARRLKQYATIENEEKRKRLMAEHVLSLYPLRSTPVQNEAEHATLAELVKRYAALDLDGEDDANRQRGARRVGGAESEDENDNDDNDADEDDEDDDYDYNDYDEMHGVDSTQGMVDERRSPS